MPPSCTVVLRSMLVLLLSSGASVGCAPSWHPPHRLRAEHLPASLTARVVGLESERDGLEVRVFGVKGALLIARSDPRFIDGVRAAATALQHGMPTSFTVCDGVITAITPLPGSPTRPAPHVPPLQAMESSRSALSGATNDQVMVLIADAEGANAQFTKSARYYNRISITRDDFVETFVAFARSFYEQREIRVAHAPEEQVLLAP